MNHRKTKKLSHFGVFAVGLMLSLASNMISKHIWAQSSIHTSSLPSVELVVQKSKRTADLQLLLVNELMGYIEPCGCTIDLKLGSIEKLDALIRRLQNDTLSAVLTVGSHLFDHDHLLSNIRWLLDTLSKNSGKSCIKIDYDKARWVSNASDSDSYTVGGFL